MNEDIPSYRVDPFSLGLDGARFDFGLPFEDRLRLMYGLNLSSKTAGASYALPYDLGNLSAQYTTPNDARMPAMTNVQYSSPAGLQIGYNDQGGYKSYNVQYNKRF